MTLKQQLHQLVDSLPEDLELDTAIWEMQYRIGVLLAVHRGLRSIDEGRGIDHEEVGARLRDWLHPR